MLRSPIVGLVVGLVIGLLVGLSIGPFDSKVEVVVAEGLSPSLTVNGARGKGAQPIAEEAPDPLVQLEPRPSGGRVAAEANLVVEAKRAIKGLRIQSRQTGEGDGEIVGRVTDTMGLPLAGTVVQAIKTRNAVKNYASSGGGASGGGGGDALPSEIAATLAEGQLREIIQAHESMREVTTGADGRYELVGLEDCGWNLKAYRKGYDCRSVAGLAISVQPGMEVNFVGEPVSRIRVSVLRPDGEGVPQASLQIRPGPGIGAGAVSHEWSPENPMLSLGEGTWEVRAVAEPMGTRWFYGSGKMTAFASEPEIIHMPPAASNQTLQLRLASRVGIAGTVRITDQRILPKMLYAKLAPCVEGEEPDLEALKESRTKHTIIGGRGFSFPDLAPGRYVVGVSLGWGSQIVAHEVVDVTGPTEVELEVAELDLSRYLLVRATGPQGRVLREVSYRVDTSAKTSMGRGARATVVRSTLGGELIELPYDVQGMGSYKLIVEHELFASEAVTVAASSREVSVQLEAPASLTVTLTGVSGDAIAGLSVSIDGGGTEPYLPRSGGGSPGPDGRVELKGLSTGEQLVAVHLRPRGTGVRFGSIRLGEWNTLLQAGPNELQIAVPATYEVSVQAPDEEPGERLILMAQRTGDSPTSIGAISGTLGAGGTATLRGLPAGSYRVKAGKSRGVVEVPGGPVLIYRKQ